MTMITEQHDLPLKTSIAYGPIRSGKTHFAATFPRVAWVGSQREGGWKTILNQDPSSFYEKNRRPLLFAVSDMNDLANHLRNDIMPRVNAGEVQTICLELTFYADDVIMSCKGGQYDTNKFLKWDTLLEHIVNLDKACKQIPQLRIHYNAIARPTVNEKHPSGMLIPGQAADKIPAMADLIGYLRADDTGGTLQRYLHLNPYGTFPAGHRYGNKLPAFLKNPTFRAIEGLLDGSLVIDAEGNAAPHDKPKAKVVGLPKIGV